MPDGQCKMARLTEKEYMTTQEGKAFAVAKIVEFGKIRRKGLTTDKRMTLWISMPCTGGPPRHYVNEPMCYSSGNEKSPQEIEGPRGTF
eukprot:1749592-Pyramimonas_sp.AAC.1